LFKRRKPDEGPGVTSAPQAQSAPADKLEVGMPSPSPFNPPARADNPAVGMPQLRPVPKEAPAMGRSPYPAQPQSTPPTPPQPATAPTLSQAPRPGIQPNRGREPAERRTLVVGRGISVQGTVQDAERLVVEGTVEASMIHATELSIAQGGVFKGAVEVEEAEIAGTIDGTLTARGNLIVRATGKLLGTANYRRLQVEDGGQIVGELKMINEAARPEPARTPAAESAS
jgi:cytoskeletal protein CcmA (bactofilin family)